MALEKVSKNKVVVKEDSVGIMWKEIIWKCYFHHLKLA